MWRLYVGGLCTGFAIGIGACWLAVLAIVPESARANLLAVPFLPWGICLAFVLAGESLRAKALKVKRREPGAAGRIDIPNGGLPG